MKTLITTLSLSLATATPLWAETAAVDWHGRSLSLEIPAGMCDFSDTGVGAQVLSYLGNANSTDPALPRPYVVYMDCDNLENMRKRGSLGYPWGYIGLPKALDPVAAQMDQAMVNSELESLAETDLMQSYLDTVNTDIDETRKEWMPGLEVDKLRGFATVLADEAVFVGYMRAVGRVDGKSFTEHVLFSTTVLDGIFINYYIYEDEDGMQDLPDHVRQLDAVAKANVAAAL